jgi:NAD+ kinase
MTRRVLLVVNDGRPELLAHTHDITELLNAAGVQVQVQADRYDVLHTAAPGLVRADATHPARGCELVVVLGGDGTILRGADVSRGTGVPLLGINFGHVGFLAEAEREDLSAVVDHIVRTDYSVEERMTLDVTARLDGHVVARNWALNEITVERAERERMLELVVEIDGRPLSSFGCDGVIVATPTGSTAYAFSAGGPVVWPDVEALCLVPISAHALFARPLVVGPDSRVAIELTRSIEGGGSLRCDGARVVDLPPATRVEVLRSKVPVHLARLVGETFTDRLVAKFQLPVTGWRGGDRRLH